MHLITFRGKFTFANNKTVHIASLLFTIIFQFRHYSGLSVRLNLHLTQFCYGISTHYSELPFIAHRECDNKVSLSYQLQV
jgi:hypothetical protein